MLTLRLTRLREHREANVLSQRDLADLAGVTALTVTRLELGQHQARPSTTRKLAKALGVKPAALVGPAE